MFYLVKRTVLLVPLLAGVMAGANSASAAEVNVCYAEKGNGNALYMNLATTKTRFICFGTDKSIRPTFNQLYDADSDNKCNF